MGGPAEKDGGDASLIRTLIDRAPGVIVYHYRFFTGLPGTEIFENPGKFTCSSMTNPAAGPGTIYPFVTPVGCSQDQVMRQRQELNRVIRRSMLQKSNTAG